MHRISTLDLHEDLYQLVISTSFLLARRLVVSVFNPSGHVGAWIHCEQTKKNQDSWGQSCWSLITMNQNSWWRGCFNEFKSSFLLIFIENPKVYGWSTGKNVQAFWASCEIYMKSSRRRSIIFQTEDEIRLFPVRYGNVSEKLPPKHFSDCSVCLLDQCSNKP